MKNPEAYLYFEKGLLLKGEGFGAPVARGGEAVFNTGMSGYQEIFTDPSYFQQVVVMTASHLGNTGVNPQDWESKKVYLSGVVCREYVDEPSNWRSTQSLSAFLDKAGVPGISGIDTRYVTQVLRDEGAQRVVLFSSAETGTEAPVAVGKKLLAKVPPMEGLELVSEVSCQSPYEYSEIGENFSDKNGTIVLYDYGAKANIPRSFALRGFKTWVVPYNFPYQEVMKLQPSAVILSNGPGDPATVKGAVENIQALLGKTPLMAVCMGHQLLARALGCQTYKLKFGHHGVNHPVKDLVTNRILITSQNHGFSVDAQGLTKKGSDVRVSHISLNDQTVEGFFSEKMSLYSVQFHPEAKPGPSDASYIFDYFVRGFVR